MKVHCPECLTEHHVEDEKIPDAGMSVRCKICGTAFRVEKEPPVQAEYDLGEDEMICPKCFITQKKNNTCMCCGLIISKYQDQPPRRKQQQQQEQQQTETCAAAAGASTAARGGARPRTPAAGAPGHYTVGELFRGLFDLSFEYLITPGMIRAIYGFLLIFGGAVALILVNYFIFAAGNYVAAIATLAAYLFSIVAVRIQAEFLIIFFRIEKNTRRIDS